MRIPPLTSALLLAALTASARADDWPKFLGPNGDSIVHEKISDSWPADGPKVVWRADLGVGFSTPVVVAGKLYCIALKNSKEVLYALDAATGKEIWNSSVGSAWTQGGMGYAGTRATPTVEGDFIYTNSGHGDLACRKLADGSVIWQISVLKDTGAKDLQWGSASSPAIVGDSIFVQGGKGGPIAVAVDKKTGQYLWKAEAGNASYSTPILTKVEGADQLIVAAGQSVFALDPATGKTLWSTPWETYYQITAASPVCRDGKIVVTGAYAHGAEMIQASATAAKVVWEKKNSIQAKFATPILMGDLLIGNSEGTITAIDWNTGTTQWTAKDKLGAGGNLLLIGENLLALSESGKMFLYKINKTGPEKIAEFQAAQGPNVWSTPTISGGLMYVKGAQEIVCYDISPK